MQIPFRIASLTFSSPVLLAPMAGYTDLPFRLQVRALGGLGLAYSEMLNPRSILYGGGRKRAAILATCPEDTPLAHQLYGKDPELMAAAAQWLVERGATLIDVNMGCPQKKIARTGAGAGLLKDPAAAVRLAKRVIASVKVPVTAKIRLGWDAHCHVAESLARDLEQAGAAALTIHGRTRGQGYAGRADWDRIGDVVRAVERMPVIGNGDIVSPETAREMFSRTGCAAIMVGRAALKNPWLIREIWNDLQGLPPLPPPDRPERLAFLRAHFERHVRHYGEHGGVVLFRKWIPQYARDLGLPREQMVCLLQIMGLDEMREALAGI